MATRTSPPTPERTSHRAGTAALVTGGSRGLGLALVEALARSGVDVVAVARDGQALDAALAPVRGRGPGAVHGIAADVGDPRTAAAVAGQAAALVGPIDLLVHNASTLGPTPMPLLLDLSADDLETVFRVNVLGPHRLSRALVGGMVVRGRGRVVTISSDAAVGHWPTWGAYGASKAALDHLSLTLAQELDGTGVEVWALDPGEMRTAMHAAAMPDLDPAARAALRDPAAVAKAIVAMLTAPGRRSMPVRHAVALTDAMGGAA